MRAFLSMVLLLPALFVFVALFVVIPLVLAVLVDIGRRIGKVLSPLVSRG